jgi:hypothetical protein
MRSRISLPLAIGLAIGTVAAAVVLGPGIAWAPPSSGGGGTAPVREQNVDADGNIKVHEQGTANVNVVNGDGRSPLYTTHVDLATEEPQGCTPISLPPGEFVIEHVHAWFVVPADSFLLIPTVVEGTFGGIGTSSSLVWLTASSQNLANDRVAAELHTALRIAEGFAETVGRMYRDAEHPVELCARDDDPDRGSRGDGVVSGYVAR